MGPQAKPKGKKTAAGKKKVVPKKAVAAPKKKASGTAKKAVAAPKKKAAKTAKKTVAAPKQKAAKKKAPEKYSKAWFMKQKKEIDLSTWTETELVALRRRSTRVFQKKQVPENLIRRILEAGRFAPTAGNYMHWRFSVIRDQKMLEEMSDDAIRMIGWMGAFLDYYKHPARKPFVKLLQMRFPNELHPIPHGVIKLVAEMSFDPLWSTPTLILLFKDVRGVGNPDIDLGICGQNMVLAAHSMGLGTCWLGLAGALGKMHKWKKALDIKYPYELMQGIAVGYPVGEADGFVERDTHAIDWFEDGEKKVVY